MHPLFRKKSRIMALVSLAFLAQCCCCILPVGWEVQRGSPEIQALVEQIETTFQIELPVSFLLGSR